MKLTLGATALTALAAASSVSAQLNPLLAGPEPISSYDAKKQSITINLNKGVDVAKAAATQNNIAPGIFIVEFDDNAPVSLNGKRSNADSHAAFHAHMKRAKSTKTKKAPKYKTRYEWKDAQLIKGLSVKLDDDADVAFLKSAPGVKSVNPARLYTNQAFQAVPASTDFARFAAAASNATASKRDMTVDTFSPHVMTGVDKLHAKGYFGKGLTVGVFDTGIDYTHPALNSGKPKGTACYGAGCQISGGRDFVGDDYNGITNTTPVTDSDPFANCDGSGHGTHVTGTIIARESADNTFTGVVPDAQVKMYRLFGCGEGTSVSTDIIIQALTYAYFDGVDVMSLSLGGAGGWQEDPGAAVASRISDLGIPVVFANGNDGAQGAFYGSSPASGDAVTAVGSVDNTEISGYSIYTVDGSDGERKIVMLTAAPWEETGTLPVKPVSLDPNVIDDGCDAAKVAAAGPFDGTVALVGRGTCTFVTKFDNLYNNGARHILVYNTPYPASYTYVVSDHDDLEVASLTRDDGLYLKAQVAAGNAIKLDFSRQVLSTTKDTNTGGLMSSFSTTTPFWELSNGPQVSAPGGNILSTWPLPLGEFAIISGTSMATPFISGTIAMFKSINGKTADSTRKIRGILSNTASPIQVAGKTQGAPGPLDTVAKQGGGLVNAYKAVFYTSRAYPSLLTLNDTRFFDGQHTVKIFNEGQKSQTYTISHAPAGTLTTVNNQTNLMNAFPVPISSAPAKASFSSKSLTIAPGQSKSFTVTFTAPAGLDPATVPVYSGFIKIDSSSSPMRGSLSVPYMGVASDTYKQKILDTTDQVAGVPLPVLLDAQGNPINDDTHTFTLQGTDVPSLAFRLRWGTALESVDLVYSNTTFVPTIPINDGTAASRRDVADYVRRHGVSSTDKMRRHHARAAAVAAANNKAAAAPAASTAATNGTYKYSDVETIGNIAMGQWVSRDTNAAVPIFSMGNTVYTNNGTTATKIPDGSYKVLLRARKQFHSFEPESSYESYLSHTFLVQGSGN